MERNSQYIHYATPPPTAAAPAPSPVAESAPAAARDLGAELRKLAALRDEGCDLMQGFHFARPLAAADFARRLAAPGAHTAPAAAGPHPTDADAP